MGERRFKETHPRVAHAWLPDTVAVETPRVFFPPVKIHRQMCVFGELFSWATPTVYPDISSLFTVASRGPVDGVERVLTPVFCLCAPQV